MKRIKMLGVAAVGAMSLMAFMGVASASAFTVWQVDGNNVTA